MEISQVEGAGRKRYTHTVVYRSGSDEETAAALAMMQWTDKAIKRETGLTLSQSGYRARKASVKRTGKDAFRNGTSEFAQKAKRVLLKLARAEIQRKVTPRFLPMAAHRLNQ